MLVNHSPGADFSGLDAASRGRSAAIAAFQVLAVLGTCLFWVGLATPALKGGPSSFDEKTGAPAAIVLVLVPVLVGVLSAGTNRFLAGLGSGAAAWGGAAIAVLWAPSIAAATSGPASERVKLGVGTFCLIGASVSLLFAFVVSVSPAQDETTHGHYGLASIGVLMVGLTVAGALIPPDRVPVRDWVGASSSLWNGASMIFLLIIFFITGARGFLSGVHGLGIISGFAACMVVATRFPADTSLVAALLARQNMPFSHVAQDSFNAVIVMILVNAAWLFVAERRATRSLLPPPDHVNTFMSSLPAAPHTSASSFVPSMTPAVPWWEQSATTPPSVWSPPTGPPS